MKTSLGAVASLCLYLVIGIYLAFAALKAVTYQDPDIVSYTIQEDRGDMAEPMRLGDYHINFSFGFFTDELVAVDLDPRIGYFTIGTTTIDM